MTSQRPLGLMTAVAAAVISLALVESVRVFLPSVVLVLGDGRFGVATAWTVVPLLAFALAPAAVALPWFSSRSLWLVGGFGLAAARLLLSPAPGGPNQATVATFAVISGTIALAALATTRRAGVRTGVFAGVILATGLHAATRTQGLVWPDTVTSRLGSVAVVAAVALCVWFTRERLDQPVTTAPAAWPWLVFAPALVLLEAVSSVPGRLAVSAGWAPVVVAAAIIAAHVFGVLACVSAARLGAIRSARLGAALILLATVGSLQPSGLAAILGKLMIPVALGLLVGAGNELLKTSGSSRRHGVFASISLAGFMALIWLYYLAYDVQWLDHRWVLLLIALSATGLGLWISRAAMNLTLRIRTSSNGVIWATACLVVFTAAGGAAAAFPFENDPAEADDGLLRVAVLDAQFGFDRHGRFAALRQAELLREQTPDIVVVNGVDRGQFATGGHDQLDLFATHLGLPYVIFGPDTDEVTGNAILSRYPIVEERSELLPQGNDPRRQSMTAVVLRIADQQLGLVATELSDTDSDTRLPQARSVAATSARFRERDVPTIVTGQLHAEAGAAELAPFDALLRSALPENTATTPATNPVVQHQHVLTSEELRRVRAQVLDSSVSHHLPVVVTFELTEPGPS